MDKERVLTTFFMAHLADSFDEGQRFNVADSSADFNDGDIDISSDFAAGGFDFVGDVRNDLNGLTEIIAAAFPLNDVFVNAARGEIVDLVSAARE